jgi:threonine dehydratase
MIRFEDVEEARRRIADAVKETPCVLSASLSEATGATGFLKYENLQRTGSFKERGAVNRLAQLSQADREKGVVAASAGNHAQALAFHATRMGIRSTIVMPVGTPLIKVTRTQRFGGEVHLVGETYDDAFEEARALAQREGSIYVSAYDDDHIIAGQGTVGLELLEQNPYLQAVVVPVGGGGLIAGIARAMKEVKPTVQIFGVESNQVPSMAEALKAGKPIRVPPAYTIAEGIAVREVGARPLEICRSHVDGWVQVDDDEVARAILWLLENEKLVAEGAGAAGVAALLSGKIPDLKGKRVGILICGGNIDARLLEKVIDRGLVESGRLCHLQVKIPDRPGELAAMLRVVGEAGVNVLEVHHERAFASIRIEQVQVGVVVEGRGVDHLKELLNLLAQHGYEAASTDLPAHGELATS